MLPEPSGKIRALKIQALATPLPAGPATRPAVELPVPDEAITGPDDHRQLSA